jgi:murein L,D-transpeptidase YafK
MMLRLSGILLASPALFMPLITAAYAESKSWRPESVAAREAELAEEFAVKGLKLGSPVFIRVYKQTSEMELWVRQGPRYVHFKTFGICRWSGVLGPKFYEGDRQSPEGLYRVTASDLIVNQRWDRAMNINYPNAFDDLNGRGGSGILIHGGCGSIGCFAVQNENVEDVYGAVRAALKGGQAYVPVLALPFRFSQLAPDKEDTLQMSEFWADLRRADLLFERDKLPPAAWICDGRYYFADRRGDRSRHAVHLPGCKPLDNSGARTARKNAPKPETPNAAAPAEVQIAATVPAGPDTAASKPAKRVARTSIASRLPSHSRRVAPARYTGSVQADWGHHLVAARGPRRPAAASRGSNTVRVRHHNKAA